MPSLKLFLLMILSYRFHCQTTISGDNNTTVLNGSVTTERFNVTSAITKDTNESTLSAFNVTSIIQTTSPTTTTTMMTSSSPKPEDCKIHQAFFCGNGDCIDRDFFCDNITHCSDGSDETSHDPALHHGRGIECHRIRDEEDCSPSEDCAKTCFLPNEYMCDHSQDCHYGIDECNCSYLFKCDTQPENTAYSKPVDHCISKVQFCDNVFNCHDESDERKYSYGAPGYQCSVTKTRITSYCMLPDRYVCDGIPDCDYGTDECFCNSNGNAITSSYWNEHCFRCLDLSLVIPSKQVCDGKFQCQDLSDECLCKDKPKLCSQLCKVGQNCGSCQIGEVMCRNETPQAPTKCIERSSVCDENYDCPLKEDEMNCNLDFSQLFNCSDLSKYIPLYQRCDNLEDCPDGSDEMNCGTSFFECNEDFVEESSLRPEAYHFAFPRYVKQCDSVPDCAYFEDECDERCGEKLPAYCDRVENEESGYLCNISNASIIGAEICDGYPTCLEMDPHLASDEMDCPKRIRCADGGRHSLPIHVSPEQKCDAVSDCYDGSDEVGCDSSTHFYCKVGTTPFYIPKSQVCDGIQDCNDGSDECQNCTDNPFSSDAYLISSYFLQVFIWIVGLFAVFGNAAVLCHNAWSLSKLKSSLSTVAFNHRILVTNLAFADFLLGVYLIGLGIANSTFKDIYCRHDIQWRASTSCVAIGTIAMISIECSVFLLAVMSTARLFLVKRPQSVPAQRGYILAGVVTAWITAMILAFTPLSESQSDYFVSGLWYKNNPFLTLASRNDVENLSVYLWSLQGKNNTIFPSRVVGSLTWDAMIETISYLNESITPRYRFGYYSAHGVCLPRIFPDPKVDKSWGFSLFIIIVNFLVFLYMFVCYITIYRTTMRKTRKAGRYDDDVNTIRLQHKISRIIFTNFCCWMPICIMAFISAGGGHLSSDAYAVSAIVLLPINSAFNPLLYSDLPEIIWQNTFGKTKCGKWVESKSLARQRTRKSSSRARLTSKVTEMTRMKVGKSMTSEAETTKLTIENIATTKK